MVRTTSHKKKPTRTIPPKRTTRTGPKSLKDNPDTVRQIESLAQLGATNQQIADFFEINITTFEGWMRDIPAIYEARKRGGITADLKVKDGLYRRALGYQYVEKTVKTYIKNYKEGPVKCEEITETTKQVAPDVTAQIFWLKNRQRDLWADVHKMEHSGTVSYRKVEDIPLDDLSPSEKDLLFNLGLKQMMDPKKNNPNGMLN